MGVGAAFRTRVSVFDILGYPSCQVTTHPAFYREGGCVQRGYVCGSKSQQMDIGRRPLLLPASLCSFLFFPSAPPHSSWCSSPLWGPGLVQASLTCTFQLRGLEMGFGDGSLCMVGVSFKHPGICMWAAGPGSLVPAPSCLLPQPLSFFL